MIPQLTLKLYAPKPNPSNSMYPNRIVQTVAIKYLRRYYYLI